MRTVDRLGPLYGWHDTELALDEVAIIESLLLFLCLDELRGDACLCLKGVVFLLRLLGVLPTEMSSSTPSVWTEARAKSLTDSPSGV